MKPKARTLAVAAMLSALFMLPAEGAQRQRWPDREGGGGRQESGGGGRQAGGGGAAAPRSAEPRGGGRGNGGGDRSRGGSVRSNGGGRREAGDGARRESPPPATDAGLPPRPRSEAAPAPRARSETRPPQDRGAGARRDGGDVSQRRPGGGDARVYSGDTRAYSGDQGGVRLNRTDRGDNRVPPGGSRVAVPRRGAPPHDVRYWRDSNIYVVPRGRTYAYYPRYYYRPYTYGYGPWGRGHFYFDLHYNSYIWHPSYVYRYDDYGSYGYPTGELRLQVHPKQAQVFVDGYYAGEVDDFDGTFQSLRLEDGEYQIEIVLPGFEPLAFDVRILPGEKVTYRGDLVPERP